MSEFGEPEWNTEKAARTLEQLDFDRYLGNTVIIGLSSDGDSYQQVCWLLGRHAVERNKQFSIATWAQGEYIQTVCEGNAGSKTITYPTMLSDNAPGLGETLHLVTTSDKTHAIAQTLRKPPYQPFGTGADLYEPEETGQRTPRVSGLLAIGRTDSDNVATHANYSLEVLRTFPPSHENLPVVNRRAHGALRARVAPGVGLTVHSYSPYTGAPRHFEGLPYGLPLRRSADQTRDYYWDRLPAKYRVAIAVLSIQGTERTYSLRNA